MKAGFTSVFSAEDLTNPDLDSGCETEKELVLLKKKRKEKKMSTTTSK